MTRQEMSAELDRVACEWRVPLAKLRGNGLHGGTPNRLVTAARAMFVRKMFAENVSTGHVAWALNMSTGSVREWYRMLKQAEQQWWAA